MSPRPKSGRFTLLVDAAIVAALSFIIIEGKFDIVDAVGEAGLGQLRADLDLISYTFVFATTGTIFFRRAFPRAVFVIGLSLWVIGRIRGEVDTGELVVLAILSHSLGTNAPRQRSLHWGLVAGVLLAVFTISGRTLSAFYGWGDVLAVFLVVVIPTVFGREIHQRRQRLIAAEERAREAEEEQERIAVEAVLAEQARIARELHDVVAHQMAVMTLQAEGAGRLADGANPQIAEALSVIQHAGREGLTEMRRMVGLLRQTSDSNELTPQPSIDTLHTLVERMERAGLPVTLEQEGDRFHLPPGTELSIYKIVSEALTNSLKHGGTGTTARVVLGYAPTQISLEITDTGHGSASRIGHPPAGHGLIGIQERVNLLNGELNVGPMQGGGFRLRVSIPVDL